MVSAIEQLVAGELDAPANPRAVAMAQALAARYPRAARAVLFYGSCLRESQLDGLMLDFYLIVSDYEAAYGKGWLARVNMMIPPNVFPFEQGGLIAKYAVLSEADFARLCGHGADNVSVWARFAQPSRLLWSADEDARDKVIAAIAQAAPTLLGLAQPTSDPKDDPNDAALSLWEHGFALTYGAEIRAERAGRSTSIVASDPARYRRFQDAAVEDGLIALDARFDEQQRLDSSRRWHALQRRGKWLTIIRLAKASFTFAGGIDYLAWKINRHAGTQITIRPWQRRWPLLGALILLPQLFVTRAIR